MRYLVTGGAGFIGSHIAESLLKDGCYVRILDNFSSGKHENLEFSKGLGRDKFEVIKGDIRNKETCRKACRGIDYVLHQAALRSVPKSLKAPKDYNETNINGTLFMLQAAAAAEVKRFVFASSSSIYGDALIFPQKEEHLPQLISPYALSKLAGEYYCRIFSQHYKLKTVALRYFNVFGPRQALDDEYAVVVPKFIDCMLKNQPPPVFGTGKQSRDFTYIDNVVAANRKAAISSVSQGVFNVAAGKDHIVLEIIDTLNHILGKSIKPKFLPVRKGDVFKTHASIAKIKKCLGYSPAVGFEEGLRRTVDFFKK